MLTIHGSRNQSLIQTLFPLSVPTILKMLSAISSAVVTAAVPNVSANQICPEHFDSDLYFHQSNTLRCFSNVAVGSQTASRFMPADLAPPGAAPILSPSPLPCLQCVRCRILASPTPPFMEPIQLPHSMEPTVCCANHCRISLPQFESFRFLPALTDGTARPGHFYSQP